VNEGFGLKAPASWAGANSAEERDAIGSDVTTTVQRRGHDADDPMARIARDGPEILERMKAGRCLARARA